MAETDRMPGPKIQELDDLAVHLADLRARGQRIVHCHGVFDLLHLGHVRHFQKAREFGDVLVVTVTPDQWVNKGPGRPVFNHQHRAEMIANLECVDYVTVNRWPSALETIRLLRPNFFVKGSEYRDAAKDLTDHIRVEEEAVREVGGALVFTEDIVFSSSTLINHHLMPLPKEASESVQRLAARHPAEELLRYIEGARSLRVLVIGETIIDEYHYCEALGKAGKEPILAVRFRSREKFAGGILAVANHVASFSDRVGLLSVLGEDDPQERFIRKSLNPKVEPSFLYATGAPTIVKRRFIESYPFQKMFEVYVMEEDQNEQENAERLATLLERRLPDYDLVIVTDYGHGMLDPKAIDLLSRHARCLAVNTQANAGNQGFNTVSKYPRADYVCVSEKELRLEARQRRQDLRRLVTAVADRLQASKVMVTRGRQGMLCYDRAEGFVEVPAFTSHFTDRVGAGDSVFAVTSLCMVQGAPAGLLGVIGNAVGAMKVAVVGNRSAIDRAALVKYVSSLLKGPAGKHDSVPVVTGKPVAMPSQGRPNFQPSSPRLRKAKAQVVMTKAS
jgi:rfaE bifunctional protein kinase chain/domain/rfaE bifunctional protein nucleotidyltransferase chain/domain